MSTIPAGFSNFRDVVGEPATTPIEAPWVWTPAALSDRADWMVAVSYEVEQRAIRLGGR